MRKKIQRTAIGLAIVAAVAIAVAAAGGRSSAVAGDPPQPDLKPEVIKPAGTGNFAGDVRRIPPTPPNHRGVRPEPKSPTDTPPSAPNGDVTTQTAPVGASTPSTSTSFAGLAHDGPSATEHWGAGWPPDPNSDVGPNHIIETVNTSIGIWNKSGSRLAAFTFDSLFSSANTGTPCDNSNQGDPVALYDPYGDRYIVTDFAWADANFATGPFYQCMAVSKTSDPVNGGWYFYAWPVESGASLPDYPKLGVWPDGIYMSANVFSSAGSESFKNVQVWAFDRVKMESNSNPSAVTFSLPTRVGGVNIFSLLPSNSRSVTGAPPAGAPNYFTSIWGSYAVRTWKFHVDWTTPGNSTFTGPSNTSVSTFNVGPSTVSEKDGNSLDTLSYRLMMQNQYTNIPGKGESLWLTHTVAGSSASVAAVRWYQLPITGGNVGSPTQQSTYAPDSFSRFMPSLAVDKNGDMGIGYSVSSSGTYPALRYAARAASDPSNTLQSEATLVQGGGFQCCTFSDGSTNTRWGDYSSMTIDPDGCTFWYTGEYYDAHPTTKAEDNWLTRIGSFSLPGCSGTVSTTPTISGFSPTSGAVGDTVTINGTNFTGATSVTFHGTTAPTFSVINSGQISATVPTGATTGTISVTTPNGTATSSASFTVTATQTAPSVGGFTPTSGPVGSSVSITGSSFTGATGVAFNGTSATFTVVNDGQINATVPTGATDGPITVTNAVGPGTSAASFTVTTTPPPTAPSITSVSPSSGPIGTTVTITGTNLRPGAALPTVTFSGVAATNVGGTATQITAKVASGTPQGNGTVALQNANGTATSSFRVSKK